MSILSMQIPVKGCTAEFLVYTLYVGNISKSQYLKNTDKHTIV